MKLWIDAQISPAIATWINQTFNDTEAEHVREVGLQQAEDKDIFAKAQKDRIVIMSKDDDFIRLIGQYGTPPQLIWVTCGNTSNKKLKEILSKTLPQVQELIKSGEEIVEISDERQ